MATRLCRIALAGLSLVARPCLGKLVTFDNTKPRLDSTGAILKAHDGTTQRFGAEGPYYCQCTAPLLRDRDRDRDTVRE